MRIAFAARFEWLTMKRRPSSPIVHTAANLLLTQVGFSLPDIDVITQAVALSCRVLFDCIQINPVSNLNNHIII